MTDRHPTLNTLSRQFNGGSTPFQHPLSPCRLAYSTVSTVSLRGIGRDTQRKENENVVASARARGVLRPPYTNGVESVEYTRQRGVRGC